MIFCSCIYLMIVQAGTKTYEKQEWAFQTRVLLDRSDTFNKIFLVILIVKLITQLYGHNHQFFKPYVYYLLPFHVHPIKKKTGVWNCENKELKIYCVLYISPQCFHQWVYTQTMHQITLHSGLPFCECDRLV
jgi:hypothetical protein